jgi:hypothetical protein
MYGRLLLADRIFFANHAVRRGLQRRWFDVDALLSRDALETRATQDNEDSAGDGDDDEWRSI